MAPACHRANSLSSARPRVPPCGNSGSRVTVIADDVRLLSATGAATHHRQAAPSTSFEENFVDFTPDSGTITMFSTTWCGYCNRLKKHFVANGTGNTEINIEEVEGTAE